MALNLTSFSNAVDRLAEILDRYRQEGSDDAIRDALIKRFEFTYEMSHKLIKHYLQNASASPAQFNTMSFPDLIRAACDAGLLLSEWVIWKGFRDLRSKSSHGYDEAVARQVAAEIPAFLTEALYLRDQLTRRAP